MIGDMIARPGVLAVVGMVLLLLPAVLPMAVLVQNGYELHASMTSASVDWILLADNITLDLGTCPFPGGPAFPATVLDRNLTIASLSPESVAAATAAGSPPGSEALAAVASTAKKGPFWLDCAYLNSRFLLTSGHTVVIDSLVLIHCRTVTTLGFISKAAGSTLVLRNSVDQRGSVCVPQQVSAEFVGAANNRTAAAASAPVMAIADAGSNWCAAAAAGINSTSTPPLLPQYLPVLMANSTSSSLCQQAALLVGNTSGTERPFPYHLQGSQGPQEPEAVGYNITAIRTAALCSKSISMACIRDNGTDECYAAAFRAVNPDENPPCPAVDAPSLHACLSTPSYHRIVILADIQLNASLASFPPAFDHAAVISRNITIESDARGPRMSLDCALLAGRFQVAAGVTVLAQHMVLQNCSVGAMKPLLFMRFEEGSWLVLNDTIVMQPDNLCLPYQAQVGELSRQVKPAPAQGNQHLQPLRIGNQSAWCTTNPNTRAALQAGAAPVNATPAATADTNSSYSKLPPIPLEFASRTGLGPAYAATLDQPARAAYFMHPTWPRLEYCRQQALLLVDADWVQSNNASSAAGNNTTAQQHEVLRQRLGGSLPVHFVNSVFICRQPSTVCTGTACLLARYAEMDPDKAAGYVPAVLSSASDSGRSYGLSVVLPAVLGSVGGALLLCAVACCVLVARRHSKHSQLGTGQGPDSVSGPTNKLHPTALAGFLFGTSSPTSSDPGRGLLTTPRTSPGGTLVSSQASSKPRSSGSAVSGGRRQLQVHDNISLSTMIGAGSYGRVYSGLWQGRSVAVKVISHCSTDDERISRELALSSSFDSLNVVRTMHFARIRIQPHSHPGSMGFSGSAGGSSLFLPEGAVGVFDLPTTWAVVKSATSTDVPVIDTEVWVVMPLMDRGTLAAAVRAGAFEAADGSINASMLLRRCADVAAGLVYLHEHALRQVCHGDLKCENVLLRSEPSDPDGLTAAIADFGLSRALALGQSHLSTRRYGTVTHMPVELLVAGKLTPAADIYSFGIMMWEMVSREAPFAGLHVGEIIHRVVTEDMRPGPWPAKVNLDGSVSLPAAYVPLAEMCWARQAAQRPSARQVLQRLLAMLAEAEAHGAQQA